jgi:signal transduction histidine kinase
MKTSMTINARVSELEKANQIIGRFITSCSHEMRAPLKSIEGLVNLLSQRSHTQEDATIFLSLIGKTTSKMEMMLNALEQLMENSRRQVIPKAMDFGEMISSILNLNEEEIKKTDVKIEMTSTCNDEMFLDRARLSMVMTDLLKNAIQFRDERKSDKIIAISLDADSEQWIIRVSDNGIGIPSDEQEKIFQLFYRATEKSSGSGIGLYLAREAVEKMNGTLGVVSVLGQKSNFEIRLPKQSA